MFAYALKEKGYRGGDGTRSNPVTNVERRKENAPNIRFLNLDEIVEQLDILKNHSTLDAIVATLIYAGLRRSEALWLTIDDVDLDRKLIYVRAKTVDGQYWQPKTKRNRTVPVSSTLHQILSEYLPERTAPWFFPSTLKKRWDPDNFSQDLREINRGHGLSWSSLDFRHTFGSHLAQNGVSLYKIAKLMGNSPEICRKHYAALMPEKMHDVVEFETGTSSGGRSTEEMLKQILDKLEPKASTETRPRLRIVKSQG
jgi:integrase